MPAQNKLITESIEADSGTVAFDVGQRGVGVEDHRPQDIGLGRRLPVPPESPGWTSLTVGSHAHSVPRSHEPGVPH